LREISALAILPPFSLRLSAGPWLAQIARTMQSVRSLVQEGAGVKKWMVGKHYVISADWGTIYRAAAR
jgi:hypothetical protein